MDSIRIFEMQITKLIYKGTMYGAVVLNTTHNTHRTEKPHVSDVCSGLAFTRTSGRPVAVSVLCLETALRCQAAPHLK